MSYIITRSFFLQNWRGWGPYRHLLKNKTTSSSTKTRLRNQKRKEENDTKGGPYNKF
jgi:hypothetical protein